MGDQSTGGPLGEFCGSGRICQSSAAIPIGMSRGWDDKKKKKKLYILRFKTDIQCYLITFTAINNLTINYIALLYPYGAIEIFTLQHNEKLDTTREKWKVVPPAHKWDEGIFFSLSTHISNPFGIYFEIGI